MALKWMSRCVLVLYLFFYPFVISQNNCPDPSTLTDSILESRVDRLINGVEAMPGNDVFLEESYTNCFAHDNYPNNYSFIGVSILFEQGGDGMDFSYIRLVYSCTGTSFIFEPSLSDTFGTAITGTNPVFLDDTFRRDDCHSCNAAVSSNEYLCEECDVACQTPVDTLGFCYGPSDTECCRYTFSGVCVSFCPGGFTPALDNTCICATSCQNSGTLNSTCQCECTLDYFGTNCENQYLPCGNDPCVNGMCVDGVGSLVYNCTCDDGFDGSNCDINIDDCGGDPCSPGTCLDSIDSYTCDCPIGYTYTGLTCTNINECDNNPCLNNGTCTDTEGNYSCDCLAPFEGRNCTDCTITCENGGVVLFDCTCDCSGISYEGNNCEIEAEYCIPNPCLNDGNCTNSLGTFSCDCPTPYMGMTCNECGINTCGNGTNIDCACVCYSGHFGEFCQEDIDDCDPNPCQNSGVCIDGNNTYTCDCSGTSYEGANCEIETFNCIPNPCLNDGICTSSLGTFSCDCPTPYMGMTCSECGINTCGNGTNIDCACVCYSGHSGEFCQEDIDDCNPNPCQNSGVCIDGNNTYTCDCSGISYEGANCEIETFNCIPNPCLNDGICTSSLGTFSCDCPTPYMGMTCSECGINTCGNGTNIDCACVCYSGHSGEFCQEDIDDCDPNPCQNSGVCIDGNNTYTCDCSGTSYEGANCEIESEHCIPNPCVNGVCTSSSRGYSCACSGGFSGGNCAQCFLVCFNGGDVLLDCSCGCSDTGYEGTQCESDINECLTTPPLCLNSGTCQNIPGSYFCTCNGGYSGKDCSQCLVACQNGGLLLSDCTCDCTGTGYEGATCQIGTDKCFPDPCINGNCTSSPEDYFCACDGGFSGKNCSQCLVACQNDGVLLPDCTCDCTDTGYEGTECESDTNECLTTPPPCQNGGTCQNTPGGYECICPSEYTGDTCSIDVNECSSVPCQGNGKCINLHGSFMCECFFGFDGQLCEIVVTDCSFIDCQNGGICNHTLTNISCVCLPGFTGDICQYPSCTDGFGPINTDCVNINECKRYPEVCGAFPAVCTDNIPFYQCGCPDGYNTIELTSTLDYCDNNECTAKQCIDIDECNDNIHDCHTSQICVNTNGSYHCSCLSGFLLNINICVLQVDTPDCPVETDGHGNIWPGANEGSIVSLKCANSDYAVATRRCVSSCSCSGDPAYWETPNHSQCSSIELNMLMAKLVALSTFQTLNVTEFKVVINRIQTFATTNLIREQDMLILAEILQEITNQIQMFKTSFQELNLYIDVLKIADVLLATAPEAWNEIGNVTATILSIHEMILGMAHGIAEYLYSIDSVYEFNFNSTSIGLSLTKFENFTNDDFVPDPNLKLILPIITPKILNLTTETTQNCHIFVRTLYLPTLHHILNNYTSTPRNCATPTTTTTTTRTLIYPIDVFTFGIHSLSCDIPTLTFDQSNPIFYRIKFSILPYKINEVSYHLNYISTYSQYASQLNSFPPSGCHGPFAELGDLVYICYSLQDYILTLQIPGTTPFHSSALGILMRIFYPLSAVLSIIGLVLLFTKYIVMVDGMTFVRINVVLIIIISQVLFFIGIDRNESHIVCTVFRFLLHYVSISSCFWALIDIVNVCLISLFDRYRVAVNSTYLIVGYIGPLVPIVLIFALSSCTYFRVSNFCFPSTEESYVAIWYIVAPLFMSILLFVCLLVGVFVVLSYKREDIRLELASNWILFVRIIVSSFTLPVFLIIWWISTVYAFTTDIPNVVFQILSLVIGSVIGMFVLFVYVIASTEQIFPSKTGRKEDVTVDFTHGAMARVSYNPLFRDTESLNDLNSLIDTRETVLSYN